MIANAFFPWLFAFGLKFNPLTFLTGISHEKLQFFHQWTARLISISRCSYGAVHLATGSRWWICQSQALVLLRQDLVDGYRCARNVGLVGGFEFWLV